MSRPLLHAFRHRGDDFVYDAGGNDLVRVDPVVAAVLREDAGDLAARPPAEVARARGELAQAHRDGLLDGRGPRRLRACDHCRVAVDTPVEHLAVTLTDRCNLRCRYCAYTHGGVAGVRRHGGRTLDPELLDSAVRLFLAGAAQVERPALSLYGGEPLLAHGLLRRALALVRDESPRPDVAVVVDTNGLLLEDPGVRRLLREHRVELQVSLDGPAAIHDRHRRTVDGGPSHARILAGLEALLEEDPSAVGRLRYQITVVDPRDIPAVAAWFRDFPPYRRLGTAPPPRVGVTMADLTGVPELRPDADPAEIHEAWERVRRAYVAHRADPAARPDPVLRALFDPEIIRWHHRDRRPLGETIAPGGFCRAGARRRHLTVDGRWQPCERVGEGHELGTLARGFDADAGNALAARFADAMQERCIRCWAVRMCGVCAASTAGRGDGGVPESTCRSVRRTAESTLRLWLDLLAEGEEATAFLKASAVA